LIICDMVSICGMHDLGFKRCACKHYAGRVVTLVERLDVTLLRQGW